jgi:ketosteroid isomerase-like protein
MSQENVDLVLQYIDSYNTEDYQAALDTCAPSVEVFPDASTFPETRPLSGRDEFGGLLEDTRSVWVGAHHATREVLDVSDDLVLTRADWGGTGTASGIEIYQSLSTIFTIRNGHICRVEYFFDHEKALKAVGLEE